MPKLKKVIKTAAGALVPGLAPFIAAGEALKDSTDPMDQESMLREQQQQAMAQALGGDQYEAPKREKSALTGNLEEMIGLFSAARPVYDNQAQLTTAAAPADNLGFGGRLTQRRFRPAPTRPKQVRKA